MAAYSNAICMRPENSIEPPGQPGLRLYAIPGLAGRAEYPEAVGRRTRVPAEGSSQHR